MFGSTFPVWAVILILGSILLFVLSCINPHLTKEDKRRLRFLRSGQHHTHEITISYRFNETVQISLSFLVSNAALICFFAEDFTKAAACLGDGFWPKVLTVIIALFCVMVAELIFMVMSFAVEKTQIMSICASVKRRYGVEIKYEFP